MCPVSSAEEKLTAVIEAARAILGKQTFAESARAIFDLCRRSTGAVSGYIALLSDDGSENEVLFLEAGGMPCTVDPSLPMPIRGLRSQAYATGCAVYENDFMRSHWVRYMPEGHVEMHNVLFAPLNIEGKTVGIIGLANKPGPFTDDDALIAALFGDLAAIALVNSRYLDQLGEKTASLKHALAEVKTLRGLLPVCAHCKKVRDDAGLWTRIESYLTKHTDTQITHSLCPDCIRELYPEDAEHVLESMQSSAKP